MGGEDINKKEERGQRMIINMNQSTREIIHTPALQLCSYPFKGQKIIHRRPLPSHKERNPGNERSHQSPRGTGIRPSFFSKKLIGLNIKNTQQYGRATHTLQVINSHVTSAKYKTSQGQHFSNRHGT